MIILNKKRKSSNKQNRFMRKELPDGLALAAIAKEAILKNETVAILPILIELLKTNCRLSAALELTFFMFKGEILQSLKNMHLY